MMTMSDLICLICDVSLDISSCIGIFYTSLPRSGELLANYIFRVLRIPSTDLCSSYICTQCYNLFEMLEQAQRTVVNIRCEILKVYRTNERRKNIKTALSNNVDLKLNTTVVFDETYIDNVKTEAETKDNQLQTTLSLCQTQLQESKQNYVQNKIANQSINDLTTNANVRIGIIDESKKDIKRKVNNYKELDSVKLYEYKDDPTEIKDDKVLKNEILHNAILAANDNNLQPTNTLHEKQVCYIERCKICDKVFKSSQEYSMHLLKHNNSLSYQCQKCKEKFSDISLANFHVLNVHAGEKNYINAVPESRKNELQNFMKTDSIFSENKLQAQDINQSIDLDWKDIEENVIDVKENSKTTAETERSQTQTSLKSKKISKQSLKPLKYSCPTCGKKWKTTAELNSHIKTHSTLRPYMCEKCGQAYKHKHALEVHVGMHNGINPFQCSFCNKCFTQKGALMRHLPMHTGETPYQCELCGKRFIHHTSYNMHRLSHTGKKSYKCHVCDLSLLSTSHLKRHMRVHTGEKPYSCTLCGKRFAERYNLFAHEKIHDPSEIKTKKAKEVEHKCGRCNLTFETKESFDDHVQCHADTEEILNVTKSSHQLVRANAKDSAKKIDTENALNKTWVQINHPKLDAIDEQAKFVLLQNPLPEIDNNSFTVTFNDHKMSLDHANYNTSLQVIIGPSDTPILNDNQLGIDKTTHV